MCGILGLIGPVLFTPKPSARPSMLCGTAGRTTAAYPDDRGLYGEPECLPGHRRLTILDLSPAGHQPMKYGGDRFVIVYNGEVYNFLELRGELEAEGEQFVTQTDTEVILAQYAKEGPNCLQRFRGMFAIAIWDKLEKILFLLHTDPVISAGGWHPFRRPHHAHLYPHNLL